MNNSNFLLFCTESTGGEIRSYCYQLTFLWLGSYHLKVAFKLFYLTVLTITCDFLHIPSNQLFPILSQSWTNKLIL